MSGTRAPRSVVILALALAVSSLAMFSSFGTAQVKKGKKRPLQTRHLMSGLVKVHCGALKKSLDAEPKNEKAWDEVVLHASLLNEASYILMSDGRCPDGTWATAAGKTLQGCSQAVLDAAAKTDVEGARNAFAALVKSCGACHKAHKKKKK